jgi:hypothetical protein
MQIDNNGRHEICPLCRSGNIFKVGNIDYFQPIMFSTMEIRLSIPPEIWGCRKCLSRFSQNIIPEPIAKSFYELGIGGKRWESDSIDRTKHPEIVSVLGRVLREGNIVLDIGANTGELLDFAKAMGCQTWGIDFCNSSRELLMKKGHAAFSSIKDISDTTFFDVIFAFDLVEHLYNFDDFINFCHLKLSKHGALIILTGNIESFSAKIADANWWYYKYPEHIIFPSKTFFKSFTNFRVDHLSYTYSSLSFDCDIFSKVGYFILGMVKGNYTALPSLGPDHMFLVLKK